MTLNEVRDYALSLPEAAEKPHFKLSSFRVHNKIFATVPPEETNLRIFVDEQRRESAIAMYPEFCEKLWWGKNVVGLDVTLADADADEVKDLLLTAWKLKAPKKLLDSYNAGSSSTT